MSGTESPTGAARRRAAALAGHVADESTARAALGDPDAKVRATALAALQRLGALDDAALRNGLRDGDPFVRRRAVTLAASHPTPPAVVDDVLGLLRDDEHLVAEAAAWTLGEWSDDNPQLDVTLDALVAMTTDHPEPLCREAAVAALGAIGDRRGLPAILAACRDKPAIRRRAVLALAPFEGPDVESAIDTALTDRDWQVRQAAEDLRR